MIRLVAPFSLLAVLIRVMKRSFLIRVMKKILLCWGGHGRSAALYSLRKSEHAARIRLRAQGLFYHLPQVSRGCCSFFFIILLECLLRHVKFRGARSCLSNKPKHDSTTASTCSPRPCLLLSAVNEVVVSPFRAHMSS